MDTCCARVLATSCLVVALAGCPKADSKPVAKPTSHAKPTPEAKPSGVSPFYEQLFVKGTTWNYIASYQESAERPGKTGKLERMVFTDLKGHVTCTVDDVAKIRDRRVSVVSCASKVFKSAAPNFPVAGRYTATAKGLWVQGEATLPENRLSEDWLEAMPGPNFPVAFNIGHTWTHKDPGPPTVETTTTIKPGIAGKGVCFDVGVAAPTVVSARTCFAEGRIVVANETMDRRSSTEIKMTIR